MVGCFLVLKKAFDTVNHRILIFKYKRPYFLIVSKLSEES